MKTKTPLSSRRENIFNFKHTMKFLLAFYPVAFLFLSKLAIAQPDATVKPAFISIAAPQPGLSVLLDGKEIGLTPLRDYSLSPGEHQLAVKRSRPESWLDFDWTEVCSLQAGDTLNFFARFHKGYSINSTPFGAQVLLGGVLQGTTPLIVRLPEGELASVEVRKTGYQSELLQIGGSVSEIRIYQVELKPEQNLPLLQEVEKTRRGLRLHHNRRISLAAAGLSLASGITAILLKDKADDLYDQYLTAGLPENRERFYQRTADYDRYAGIATAVFEASFAVSFYYFMKSTRE